MIECPFFRGKISSLSTETNALCEDYLIQIQTTYQVANLRSSQAVFVVHNGIAPSNAV